MITLTHDQLSQLRDDLLHSADIEYAEVMDELLDHYASLTEQSMDEGLPFDEASQKAWIRLGSGQGLNHMQERYKKLLVRQIKGQHWAIVRSYFRWPTIVTTILIGVLTYLFANFAPTDWLFMSFLAFSFSPYLLFIPSTVRYSWRVRIRRQSLLRSLKQEVIFEQTRYTNQLNFICIQLPALVVLFLGDDKPKSFMYPYLFEWHAGLSAAITFAAVLYTITFIELYRKKGVPYAIK